ncbi:MAG: DEAD/DEAH box helicase family protein, partial [Nitrosotalea sp.]
QKEILKGIEEKIKSGYKTIILSAPTGVGKSLIAATLARYFGSSFVVTASKQLQDQYSKDLKFLMPVKGKSNFACLKLMEQESIEKSDTRNAIQRGLTCEKGLCEETTMKNGKKVKEICQFKPKLGEPQDITKELCHYYEQKYRALTSPHSIWNYAAYFQLMRFNRKAYEEYVKKPIAIFDEAHKVEDQIIQFIGVDIYNAYFTECGIDAKKFDNLGDIDTIAKLLEGLAKSYAKQILDLQESRAFMLNPDYATLAKLESRYEKMSNSYVEINSNKDNFVVNDPFNDERGNFRSVSIKPLDISKYVKAFFDIENQVFMSATIDKDSFCENTGLDPSKVG